MKKCLLIAGLAVLSTSAYATTTRLQALGQDTTRGSFFIDDNYNVFRNAAYVNQYKNYMVTEWGQENGNQAAKQKSSWKVDSFVKWDHSHTVFISTMNRITAEGLITR